MPCCKRGPLRTIQILRTPNSADHTRDSPNSLLRNVFHMRKLQNSPLQERKMSATRPQPTMAPGARRGAQFLARLRESPPNLWYRGEQVKDVTTHPALRGGVGTIARLYDLQWERADETLYTSPTSGRKVAKSFMMPQTQAELRGVSAA